MGYKGVLIVEDDRLRRHALEDAVRALKLTSTGLISTDNLSEAIAIIKNNRIECVIMGWDFPSGPQNFKIEENGGELLQVVKKMGLKAVICTNRAGQLTDEELLGTPVIPPIPIGNLDERLAKCIA